MNNTPTQKAFIEWEKIPELEIYNNTEAFERYGHNTIDAERFILGALRPLDTESIKKIVIIAQKYKVSLYTFSTGHNWGFGSSLPPVNNCVIVDLSRMKKIVELNEHMGYVTLEPGVTQQDLYDYLNKKNLDFMVPTTGAGPSCSIIGNMLDKGYGITPYQDHFDALLSLRAILPNGDIYNSSFYEFGANVADKIYKWKVGPYLEGLFVQGNFGIVTQATIALARKPQKIGQYIVMVDAKDLKRATKSIANMKEQLGSMIGGINLMNAHRLLAMIEKEKIWNMDGVTSDEQFAKIKRKRSIPDWGIVVGIYCPEPLMRHIVRILKKEFGSYAHHTVFLNRSRITIAERLLGMVPRLGIGRTVSLIHKAYEVIEGIPSEVALPLAYIKNPQKVPTKNLHPDRDGCGELWYNPVLPIDGDLVERFTREVVHIMVSEGFEPMITLTGVNQRCFASNIPIIFDRSNELQCSHSKSCLKKLMKLAYDLQIFPDRLDIDTMRDVYDFAPDSGCFKLAETIKSAIDPDEIFSPGRYMRVKEKNKKT